jgi:hypothetical protein
MSRIALRWTRSGGTHKGLADFLLKQGKIASLEIG